MEVSSFQGSGLEGFHYNAISHHVPYTLCIYVHSSNRKCSVIILVDLYIMIMTLLFVLDSIILLRITHQLGRLPRNSTSLTSFLFLQSLRISRISTGYCVCVCV